MSDCCNSTSGFPSASTMVQLATNNAVVWEEICKLQQGILSASSQCQIGGGQMCTTIGGNTPMTVVSSVTGITVTHGGAGYVIDTPSVKIIPPYNSLGAGATATLVTNGGTITSITVGAGNGGSGYSPIHATLSVTSVGGASAVLTPVVDALGQIIAVNITNPGTGYTIADTIQATRAVAPNPLYINAVIKITSIGTSGEIQGVSVITRGSGYEDSVTTVQIVSTLNTNTQYPTGVGFNGTVNVNGSGVVTSVTIVNGGVGFAPINPYLVLTNSGTGATTSLTVSSGAISAVQVLTGGNGYVSPVTATIYNPITASLPNPPSDPAVVSVAVNVNTYGTVPTLYYQVNAGLVTDKQIQTQLDTVITYFKKLGYTISIITNPITGNTIQWRICW